MKKQTLILHLIVVFLVAFGARMTVFVLADTGNREHPEAGIFYSFHPDILDFTRLGENLSRFGMYADRVEPPVIFHAERGPGYPAALAAVFVLFGVNMPLAILLQIIFGALIACGIYLLARTMAPAGAALAAGLLFALDGPSIIYANLVMTETLAAGLFILVVYILAGLLHGDATPAAWWKWAALGVALAALTYVRTAFLLLPLVVLVACAWRFRAQRRELVRSGALLAAAFALAILPWCVRNQMVFGHFAFSSGAGRALCTWNMLPLASPDEIGMDRLADKPPDNPSDNATVQPADDPTAATQKAMNNWLTANIAPPGRNPFEADAEFRSVGRSILMAHLGEIPRAFAVAAFRSMLGPGNSYFVALEAGTGLPFARLGLGLWMLWMLALLAWIWGTIALWRRPKHRAVAIFVLLAVVYSVAIAFLQGYSRFRVPVLPAMYVISAVGLHGMWRMIVARGKRIPSPATPPASTKS